MDQREADRAESGVKGAGAAGDAVERSAFMNGFKWKAICEMASAAEDLDAVAHVLPDLLVDEGLRVEKEVGVEERDGLGHGHGPKLARLIASRHALTPLARAGV